MPTPVVSRCVAVVLLLASSSAVAQKVGEKFGDECRTHASASLTDCVCLEREAAQLQARDRTQSFEVVFDRAAAACPSRSVTTAGPNDPRYRHHSFEQRQAIRRIALEFTAALDSESAEQIIARLEATPTTARVLQMMPAMRAQHDERIRGLLERRAARGAQTNRRVVTISTDSAIVQARASVPVPGVPGESAYVTQEVVQISFSDAGMPKFGGYDYGF